MFNFNAGFENFFAGVKASKESRQLEEIEVKEPETVTPDPEETINSNVIREDIDKSFAEVLKEFDLTPSKETEIDKIESKIESMKQSNQHVIDKINKLKAVGLVGTPSVKKNLKVLEEQEENYNTKIQELKDSIKRAQEVKDLKEEYMQKYPTYKFVTKEVMVDIMKRYSLIMGESFCYAKEIPDKSLDIISNFSKEIEESREEIVMWEVSKGHHYYETVLGSVSEREKQRKKGNQYVYDIDTLPMSRSKFKMVAPQSHFEIPTRKVEKNSYSKPTTVHVPLMKLNKDNILEFTPLEYNKIQAKNREILDLIACLEVEGGYIIMDAWDEEANIPEIQNLENLN